MKVELMIYPNGRKVLLDNRLSDYFKNPKKLNRFDETVKDIENEFNLKDEK